MWFIGVEVEQETSAKNPGSAPDMRNVSAEIHMSLNVYAKYGSHMPRNRRTILNVKVIHYPCKCEPLSKIGRLSLINIELKLFQDCQRLSGSLVRRVYHAVLLVCRFGLRDISYFDDP